MKRNVILWLLTVLVFWIGDAKCANTLEIDISQYTETASKMTVLSNGNKAILDSPNKKVFFFDSNWNNFKTLDISNYVTSAL